MISALIILGVVLVLIVFASLFTTYGQSAAKTRLFAEIELGSNDFWNALGHITSSSTMQYRPEEEISVISSGTQFLEDLLQEIDGAKSSIAVTNYIWHKGRMTNAIFEALTLKARQGIEVRVLLDGLGSLQTTRRNISELRRAGGKVKTFRPIKLSTLTRINKPSHARAIIIDGKVAYTGGLAFKDGWLADEHGEEEWHDLMFKLSGFGARAVQNIFASLWRNTHGEILAGEQFYPPLTLAPTESENRLVYLLHAPAPDLDKDLVQLLWLSIVSARSHILIETPYLVPDPELLSALKERARAGVRVEIIVPGQLIDAKYVKAATLSYYQELLEAGVKIFEYRPAKLHTKIMVIDGTWSIIGSANFDQRSLFLNIESVVGLWDSRLAGRLEEEFKGDKNTSDEVPSNFRLNLAQRIVSELARLFAKQF
jgi:cardiolipin synthase A/B